MTMRNAGNNINDNAIAIAPHQHVPDQEASVASEGEGNRLQLHGVQETTYVAGPNFVDQQQPQQLQSQPQRPQGSQHQPTNNVLANVRMAISKLFTESVAVHMHSVGMLGENERLDETGTLHYYVSLQRHTKNNNNNNTRQANHHHSLLQGKHFFYYGTLDDLFHQEPLLQHVKTKEEQEEEQDGTGYDEEEELDVVEGGSLSAAIFGIIKGTVGPAILYLPRGFQQSGWAVSVPSMLFATYMFIYNAYRLLECWKVESDKNHAIAERIQTTLKAMGTSCDHTTSCFTPTLLTYPELAKRSLGSYAFLVDFGIASMQYGVCLSYLIFVPQNLQQCVSYWSGYAVPKPMLLLCMVLIEIPLTWITDIRKLTTTNVAATVLTAFGLVAVLGMACIGAMQRNVYGNTLLWATNLQAAPAITDTWFVFIGTSFFMMEGSMTLVVPLQEAVFLKKDRELFPTTNAIVTTWIVVFYIAFAFICIAGFGDGVRTALTASLKGSVAAMVQMAYSIAVIMTFPLQAFPAMQVAIIAALGKNKASFPSIERSIVASMIVVLLGIVAWLALDYLGNVVSILGSLFGIPLALVYPPLMHNILIKDSSTGRRIANYAVVGIGFLAMALASYATITNWHKNAEGSS